MGENFIESEVRQEKKSGKKRSPARTVHTGNSTNAVANVGLMYPSDYIYTYSNGVDNTCYTNVYKCKTSASGTPTNGWLYNSLSTSVEWLISTININTDASRRETTGILGSDGTRGMYASRPVVYLRSDIKITDGDGSQSNPYQIQ